MTCKSLIRFVQKSLATTLSLALLLTSSSLAEAAMPAAVQDFHPPARLGYLTDQFQPAPGTAPAVVLIQDLHAHYGVQKNIAGLLEHLNKQLTDGSSQRAIQPTSHLSFVVAVEGASGPVDNSILATFPDTKIRASAADYLMRQGELTGAEYFAVMNGLAHPLVGVEDPTLYTLHRDLFRKTFADRERTLRLLLGMQQDIRDLERKRYSKSLKIFERKLNAYREGRVGASDLIRAIEKHAAPMGFDVSALRKSGGEDFQNKLESLTYLIQTQLASTQVEKDLVQLDHDLTLLLKVVDLRATETDVRTFAPRLNQFVALAETLLKGEGRKEMGGTPGTISPLPSPLSLRSLISSSIDYYATAMARNKPMVEKMLALLQQSNPTADQPNGRSTQRQSSKNAGTHHNDLPVAAPPPAAPTLVAPPSTVVLITGGFHTAPIKNELRARRISYVVFTPNVDKITEADHDLYVKRLNGDLLSPKDIFADTRFFKPHRSFLAFLPSPLSSLLSKQKAALHPGVGIVTGPAALMALYRAWANGVALRVTVSTWQEFKKSFAEFIRQHPSETTAVSGELREAPVTEKSSSDAELIRAIGQRIEILPVKDMTQGGAGPKALKRAEKAKRILAATVRRLEKRGLSDTERSLFRFLVETEQGRALALEWRLYSSGGFFSPDIHRVWFGRQSEHSVVNMETGEREYFSDSRNSWFIFKHELGHMLDHFQQVSGTHLTPNEPFRVQRKVYAEFRANLYAYDWDYEKAFEATWTFNGYKELAQLLGLPKGDARAMYALVERLARDIQDPLEGPALEQAKAIIAADAAKGPSIVPDTDHKRSDKSVQRPTSNPGILAAPIIGILFGPVGAAVGLAILGYLFWQRFGGLWKIAGHDSMSGAWNSKTLSVWFMRFLEKIGAVRMFFPVDGPGSVSDSDPAASPMDGLWGDYAGAMRQKNYSSAMQALIQLSAHEKDFSAYDAVNYRNAYTRILREIAADAKGISVLEALESLLEHESPEISNRAAEMLRVVMDEIGKASNVVFSIEREITPRTVRAARAALEAIQDSNELLAKAGEPIHFEITKIEKEDVFGNASIGLTAGAARMGVTQHELAYADDPKALEARRRQTAVHELLHKLATVTDKSGKDLVFPIVDWIALLELHGYDRVYIEGYEIPIREHLAGEFKIVKDRIRRLDAKKVVRFGQFLDKKQRYRYDPHEVLAWNGVGQGRGFGNPKVARDKTLELLRRNLLRTNQSVYLFDPTTGRWTRRPATPAPRPGVRPGTNPGILTAPFIGILFGPVGAAIGLGILGYLFWKRFIQPRSTSLPGKNLEGRRFSGRRVGFGASLLAHAALLLSLMAPPLLKHTIQEASPSAAAHGRPSTVVLDGKEYSVNWNTDSGLRPQAAPDPVAPRAPPAKPGKPMLQLVVKSFESLLPLPSEQLVSEISPVQPGIASTLTSTPEADEPLLTLQVVHSVQMDSLRGLAQVTASQPNQTTLGQLGRLPLFHYAFPDLQTQSQAMERLAIFEEDKDLHGQILTDQELDARLTPRDYLTNSNFNVRQALRAGYDIPAGQIGQFFTLLGEQLNPAERQLRQVLLQRGILIKEGNTYKAAGPAVLITTVHEPDSATQEAYVGHEAGHGLYFLDPGYQRTVDREWQSLSDQEREILKRFFRFFGYADHVMPTEFAEYLAEPDQMQSELEKIYEAAAVHAPGQQVTPERQAEAAALYRDMMESREAQGREAGGVYLKPGFRKLFESASRKIQKAKQDALRRNGLSETGDPQVEVERDTDFSRPIHRYQGPRTTVIFFQQQRVPGAAPTPAAAPAPAAPGAQAEALPLDQAIERVGLDITSASAAAQESHIPVSINGQTYQLHWVRNGFQKDTRLGIEKDGRVVNGWGVVVPATENPESDLKTATQALRERMQPAPEESQQSSVPESKSKWGVLAAQILGTPLMASFIPGAPKRRGRPPKNRPSEPPQPFDPNSDKPILLVPVNIPDAISMGFFGETVDLYKTLRHYMESQYGVEVVMVEPFANDEGVIKRYAGEDIHLLPRKEALKSIPRKRLIGIVASFWASGEAEFLSQGFPGVPVLTIPKPGESGGVSGISLARYGKWAISEEVDATLQDWSYTPETIQAVNDDLLREASALIQGVTGYPANLGVEFLSRRTFGIGYAYRPYSLQRYLALLVGHMANHSDAYPNGITYLYSLHDNTGFYGRGQNGQINPKTLSYVNAAAPVPQHGPRVRVLVASYENPGEYVYYIQNRPYWVKEYEVSARDIVMVPTPPLSKELFVKSMVTAASQPGQWWVPNLMTGIGSYIDAAAIQVATRLPAFHDGTIAHVLAMTEDVLGNFLLQEPWAEQSSKPVQAFLARTPAEITPEELQAAASKREAFFRVPASREFDLETYHRFKEAKELGPDLAAEVAAKLNIKPISSDTPGILAAPIIGILFGPVGAAIGLGILAYMFWQRLYTPRRLTTGARWDAVLEALSDQHSPEVEAYVGTARMPDDKKFYLGKLLERTSLRFSIEEVVSLATLLQDPSISQDDISLIDRFIVVPGITGILRRLDKDQANRIAILAELYAARALQGLGQLMSLGVEVRDANGRRKTEFDEVLRKSNGHLAIVEVKAGQWSQGDIAPTAEQWMNVMLRAGEQKLNQVYSLMGAAPQDLTPTPDVSLPSIDQLIFAVLDTTSSASERFKKEHALQSQLDQVSRKLAASVQGRKPLQVRVVLFHQGPTNATSNPVILAAPIIGILFGPVGAVAGLGTTGYFFWKRFVRSTGVSDTHLESARPMNFGALAIPMIFGTLGIAFLVAAIILGTIVIGPVLMMLFSGTPLQALPVSDVAPAVQQGGLGGIASLLALLWQRPPVTQEPVRRVKGPTHKDYGAVEYTFDFGKGATAVIAIFEDHIEIKPQDARGRGDELYLFARHVAHALGKPLHSDHVSKLSRGSLHAWETLTNSQEAVFDRETGIYTATEFMRPVPIQFTNAISDLRGHAAWNARSHQEKIRLLRGPIELKQSKAKVYEFGFGREATAKLVVYPDRVELRPDARGRGEEVYRFATYAARVLDRRLVSDKGTNLSTGAQRAWGRMTDRWTAYFNPILGRFIAHEAGEMEPKHYKDAIDQMLETVPDPYTSSYVRRFLRAAPMLLAVIGGAAVFGYLNWTLAAGAAGTMHAMNPLLNSDASQAGGIGMILAWVAQRFIKEQTPVSIGIPTAVEIDRYFDLSGKPAHIDLARKRIAHVIAKMGPPFVALLSEKPRIQFHIEPLSGSSGRANPSQMLIRIDPETLKDEYSSDLAIGEEIAHLIVRQRLQPQDWKALETAWGFTDKIGSLWVRLWQGKHTAFGREPTASPEEQNLLDFLGASYERSSGDVWLEHADGRLEMDLMDGKDTSIHRNPDEVAAKLFLALMFSPDESAAIRDVLMQYTGLDERLVRQVFGILQPRLVIQESSLPTDIERPVIPASTQQPMTEAVSDLASRIHQNQLSVADITDWISQDRARRKSGNFTPQNTPADKVISVWLAEYKDRLKSAPDVMNRAYGFIQQALDQSKTLSEASSITPVAVLLNDRSLLPDAQGVVRFRVGRNSHLVVDAIHMRVYPAEDPAAGVSLDKPVRFGRDENNGLVFKGDTTVSRVHGVIVFTNGQVIVRDLDSKYGIRVLNPEVPVERASPAIPPSGKSGSRMLKNVIGSIALFMLMTVFPMRASAQTVQTTMLYPDAQAYIAPMAPQLQRALRVLNTVQPELMRELVDQKVKIRLAAPQDLDHSVAGMAQNHEIIVEDPKNNPDLKSDRDRERFLAAVIVHELNHQPIANITGWWAKYKDHWRYLLESDEFRVPEELEAFWAEDIFTKRYNDHYGTEYEDNLTEQLENANVYDPRAMRIVGGYAQAYATFRLGFLLLHAMAGIVLVGFMTGAYRIARYWSGKVLRIRYTVPHRPKHAGSKNMAEDDVDELRETHPKIDDAIRQGAAIGITNLQAVNLDLLFLATDKGLAERLTEALQFNTVFERSRAVGGLAYRITSGGQAYRDVLKNVLRSSQEAIAQSSHAADFERFRFVLILSNDPFFQNARLLAHTGSGKKSELPIPPSIYLHWTTPYSDRTQLQYLFEHERGDFLRGSHGWSSAEEEEQVLSLWDSVKSAAEAVESQPMPSDFAWEFIAAHVDHLLRAGRLPLSLIEPGSQYWKTVLNDSGLKYDYQRTYREELAPVFTDIARMAETARNRGDGKPLTNPELLANPKAYLQRLSSLIDHRTSAGHSVSSKSVEPPVSTPALPEKPLIVIAEDEPQIRELLGRALSISGFTVVGKGNGQEALEYVTEHPVSLLFTDMDMPVMRGNELIRRARALKPDLPIVVMSGLSMVEAHQLTEEYPGLIALNKPFPMKTAVEAAKQLLGNTPQTPTRNSDATSLLKHYRVHQVVAAWTGIAVNMIRAAISPRFRDHLFDELRAVEAGMNLALAANGEKSIRVQPYGFDVDQERSVSWYSLWGTFGTADVSGGRVVQINPFLPSGMKLLTTAHETLHVLHLDWNEAQVIKMSEVYVKARDQQIQELPSTVSRAEAAVRGASPRAKLQDLIPVVSLMLKDRNVTPKEAKAVTDALDPQRLAFLASA